MPVPVPMPKFRPHDARGVANSFLNMAAQEGRSLDQLQIQKLVYFSHGWHLAVTGEPLIRQDVLAWPYGPVVRQVYDEFKSFGRAAIDDRATFYSETDDEWVPYSAHYTPASRKVIDRVWDVYKGFSGLQMSAMAHAEGTPWHQQAGHLEAKQVRDIVIPNPLIRRHYLQLAKERQGLRAK